MPEPTTVEVYTSINGEDVRTGRLHSHFGRRTETATFTYNDSYPAGPRAYTLDPSLPLLSPNGTDSCRAGTTIYATTDS